jgi:hypothetical protein
MLVWDYDEHTAEPRVVFAHKCDKYLAWNSVETIEEAEKVVSTVSWDYAKEIDEQPYIEITVK